MTGSDAGEPLKAVGEMLGDARIAPAHGIAAIALSMAMKYHDMNMVHDGALYQQYKVEGRNIMPLDLATVFETAMQIERHLMASSERIAQVLADVLIDDSQQAAE